MDEEVFEDIITINGAVRIPQKTDAAVTIPPASTVELFFDTGSSSLAVKTPGGETGSVGPATGSFDFNTITTFYADAQFEFRWEGDQPQWRLMAALPINNWVDTTAKYLSTNPAIEVYNGGDTLPTIGDWQYFVAGGPGGLAPADPAFDGSGYGSSYTLVICTETSTVAQAQPAYIIHLILGTNGTFKACTDNVTNTTDPTLLGTWKTIPTATWNARIALDVPSLVADEVIWTTRSETRPPSSHGLRHGPTIPLGEAKDMHPSRAYFGNLFMDSKAQKLCLKDAEGAVTQLGGAGAFLPNTGGTIVGSLNILGGITQAGAYFSGGVGLNSGFYAMTGSTVIVNSTTETSMFSDETSIGTRVVPANALHIGQSFETRCSGIIKTRGNNKKWMNVFVYIRPGSGPPQLLIQKRFQDRLPAPARWFEFRAGWTVRSIGTTGQIIGNGTFAYTDRDGTDLTSHQSMTMESAVTVDTTDTNELDVTWRWEEADPQNHIDIQTAVISTTA